MKIKIFYNHTNFRLRKSGSVKSFIDKVIREEKRIPGDLNFVFTTDNELLKINKEFLNHGYFTDVITFDYNEGDEINGEIYLSVEKIRENSVELNIRFYEEILRVMLHGVLHLLGYDDSTKVSREKMFEVQENKLRELLNSI